jgi:hypothetical protein
MRFLFIFLLTWIAVYFTLLIFPWWTAACIAFVVILLFPAKKAITAFFAPGLGSLCCWVMALLIKDIPNQHLLSGKIAVLFQLPSYVFLVVISGFLGFITAGLGGWTATCVIRAFRSRSDKSEAIQHQ